MSRAYLPLLVCMSVLTAPSGCQNLTGHEQDVSRIRNAAQSINNWTAEFHLESERVTEWKIARREYSSTNPFKLPSSPLPQDFSAFDEMDEMTNSVSRSSMAPFETQVICRLNIVGDGKPGSQGLVSPSMACHAKDGVDVIVYMGETLLRQFIRGRNTLTGVEFHGAPKSTSLDENAMVFADNRTIAIVNSTFANLTMTGVSPLITHSKGTLIFFRSQIVNIAMLCCELPKNSSSCPPVMVATGEGVKLAVFGSFFKGINCLHSQNCTGGALWITNQAEAYITHTTFVNNMAGSGAALLVSEGAGADVRLSAFLANRVAHPNRFGAVMGMDCQASEALSGKELRSPDAHGQMLLDSVIIMGNAADGEGAGVTLWQCPNATIHNAAVAKNSARGSGGGLAIIASHNTSLNHTKFYQNSASYGGAVMLSPCLLHMNMNYIHSSGMIQNQEVMNSSSFGCSLQLSQDDSTGTALEPDGYDHAVLWLITVLRNYFPGGPIPANQVCHLVDWISNTKWPEGGSACSKHSGPVEHGQPATDHTGAMAVIQAFTGIFTIGVVRFVVVVVLLLLLAWRACP